MSDEIILRILLISYLSNTVREKSFKFQMRLFQDRSKKLSQEKGRK